MSGVLPALLGLAAAVVAGTGLGAAAFIWARWRGRGEEVEDPVDGGAGRTGTSDFLDGPII